MAPWLVFSSCRHRHCSSSSEWMPPRVRTPANRRPRRLGGGQPLRLLPNWSSGETRTVTPQRPRTECYEARHWRRYLIVEHPDFFRTSSCMSRICSTKLGLSSASTTSTRVRLRPDGGTAPHKPLL